ncbi:hypothetical protein [Actinoplanes sp. URMC 104]|uniref:hypothetical protein n=1 Tax=Actinoplanes sp. URMC 104 TaxID=3423409 RepID=UPI003F1CFAB7
MTSAHPPENDPAPLLIAAERDSLLIYDGFVGGDQFEIVLAGRKMMVSGPSVAPMVRVLRRLRQARGDGLDLTVSRFDEEQGWRLAAGGRPTAPIAPGAALPWIDGYVAAAAHIGARRESTFAAIRALLTSPSGVDRSRLTLLGVMWGRGPENEISGQQLAIRAGWTKKTVSGFLQFGANVPVEHLDRLMEATGCQWADRERRVGVAGMDPAPEMPGIRRLRLILAAEDKGWLAYLDEPDPSKARRLVEYKLAVGDETHRIGADELVAWLDGMAFFHGEPLEGAARQ